MVPWFCCISLIVVVVGFSRQAYAKCMASSCYVLSMRVQACEHGEVSNEKAVRKLLYPDLIKNKKDEDNWLKRTETLSGYKIDAQLVSYKEVPCYEGAGLVNTHLPGLFDKRQEFFALSDSSTKPVDVCRSISESKHEVVQMFYKPVCCDVSPGGPECYAPPIVSKLPDWLK